MIDFGHCREMTSPRAQTGIFASGLSTPGASAGIQAQFLILAKPLDRQVSHFQAAGEENWK